MESPVVIFVFGAVAVTLYLIYEYILCPFYFYMHQKFSWWFFLITVIPIVLMVFYGVGEIETDIDFRLYITVAFLAYFGSYIILIEPPKEKEKRRQEELQKEADKKEQKRLKKERWQTKKCAWCGCTFYWAESGYRWHCSRRCEAQDRNS